MPKDDPETAALKKELNDIIGKCKVIRDFNLFVFCNSIFFSAYTCVYNLKYTI